MTTHGGPLFVRGDRVGLVARRACQSDLPTRRARRCRVESVHPKRAPISGVEQNRVPYSSLARHSGLMGCTVTPMGTPPLVHPLKYLLKLARAAAAQRRWPSGAS